MNKVKITDVIQTDLAIIKSELIKNPRVFILMLLESLKLVKNKPFSAYKVDLSLNYLKKVYERAFPLVKHGGPRISKAKETTYFARNSRLDQVPATVTWAKGVPLADKAIIMNLFEGVRVRRKVPSFVKLIGLRSELSRPTIQDRIRVGNYIANFTEGNRSILLFRSNKISHTKFLAEIIKIEKKSR